MRAFAACFFVASIIFLISLGLIKGQPGLSLGNPHNVSAAPASAPAIFRPNNLTDTVRFAVIGDYGSGSADETAVADLVKSWNPDFIITTGDNNYPSGAAATIDRNIGRDYHDFIYPYRGSYAVEQAAGPLISTLDVYTYQIYLPIILSFTVTNRFFPALGNHDWLAAGAVPYLDYFVLPGNERYYDFVRGPVHFFALDSDPHEPDGISSSSIQAAWLQNELVGSSSCWNLVYFHHSPYSSGPHGSNPTMQWPYQAWGADAVLTGHDHDYERIVLNGFPYFVNGLGGYTRYSFQATAVTGSEVRYNNKFGAMLVVADQTSITYKFIAVDGTDVDTYSQNGGCP